MGRQMGKGLSVWDKLYQVRCVRICKEPVCVRIESILLAIVVASSEPASHDTTSLFAFTCLPSAFTFQADLGTSNAKSVTQK